MSFTLSTPSYICCASYFPFTIFSKKPVFHCFFFLNWRFTLRPTMLTYPKTGLICRLSPGLKTVPLVPWFSWRNIVGYGLKLSTPIKDFTAFNAINAILFCSTVYFAQDSADFQSLRAAKTCPNWFRFFFAVIHYENF